MTPTTFLVAAMGLEVVDHQLRCARVERLHAAQLAEPVMTVDRDVLAPVHHLRADLATPVMTAHRHVLARVHHLHAAALASASGGVAEPGVDATRTGFEALTFLTFALEPGGLS